MLGVTAGGISTIAQWPADDATPALPPTGGRAE
jgi:hypothetical protein